MSLNLQPVIACPFRIYVPDYAYSYLLHTTIVPEYSNSQKRTFFIIGKQLAYAATILKHPQFSHLHSMRQIETW